MVILACATRAEIKAVSPLWLSKLNVTGGPTTFTRALPARSSVTAADAVKTLVPLLPLSSKAMVGDAAAPSTATHQSK
ncbi:hypothetical protein EDD66_102327 [Mobilisporobacter senegalensis]|uniref:Uncharacterized protein n=1 Tax=Mobilisporobacter senegalensis TaxID=1329262 RepID=A0A3N1XZJ8_9FIRM|nr:hypothetical protein EDD66_102327 [Mobilisporobacter senegalensis]